MNENVRKVFDILGIEPYEKFKVNNCYNILFFINKDLNVYDDQGYPYRCDDLLKELLINPNLIIKLPKKKKLRDSTPEEYEKWFNDVCKNRMVTCRECMFNNVICEPYTKECWVNHKDLYSDNFLDQEIKVE